MSSSSNKKRVAIIGGGKAGLASARHMLDAGLEPFVFENKSAIGGLWSCGKDGSTQTAIWSSMHGNISKYLMTFVGNPWPKDSALYPNKKQTFDYMSSFARRFNLFPYIHFECNVNRVWQSEDKTSWWIEWTELATGHTRRDVFEFLVIASGFQELPVMPELTNNQFNGLLIHSSEFEANIPLLKDKRVVVVGCSHSGLGISSELTSHASSVTNLFLNPYLCVPRLLKFDIDEQKCRIVPHDFLSFARQSYYSTKYAASPEEARAAKKAFYRRVCPKQTDQNKIHPDLFYDLDKNDKEVRVGFCDNYLELVEEGKLIPKKGKIKELCSEGIRLEDETVIETDAVVFCTGYTIKLAYLDKSVLDQLFSFDSACDNFRLKLYKYTLSPYIRNIALNTLIYPLHFIGSELQARLAALTFSGKMVLDQTQMEKEVNEMQIEMRTRSVCFKQAYGSHFEMIEHLARLLGLMPDLKQLEESEGPIFCKRFVENLALPEQYFMNESGEIKKRVLELMNEIDEMTNRVYEFDSTKNFTFQDIVNKYNEFYKFQLED